MTVSKRPTDVSLVLDVLVGRDDFMSRAMLAEATRLPLNRLHVALLHLLHYKCAEAVAVGQELWYMATPESDTRVRKLVEIREGITRKRAKKRAVAKKNVFILQLTQAVGEPQKPLQFLKEGPPALTVTWDASEAMTFDSITSAAHFQATHSLVNFQVTMP